MLWLFNHSVSCLDKPWYQAVVVLPLGGGQMPWAPHWWSRRRVAMRQLLEAEDHWLLSWEPHGLRYGHNLVSNRKPMSVLSVLSLYRVDFQLTFLFIHVLFHFRLLFRCSRWFSQKESCTSKRTTVWRPRTGLTSSPKLASVTRNDSLSTTLLHTLMGTGCAVKLQQIILLAVLHALGKEHSLGCFLF